MKPTLPGYQIKAFIGDGVCGGVWAAEDPMGNEVAVRVFDALAINLDHVREVGQRLDGFHPEGHGPVPIWLQALDRKPALQVMPLLAEPVEEGSEQVVPRSLQVQLAEYLGTGKAESLVKCLAKALANLHRKQVVHGNLKPGNIFISEEGRVQVGDYGLGWMPGIDYLSFSDALLYMAPEQIVEPEGLFREAGYRWDVYAFGVMAYRLLEGRFPRCHESFHEVAPAPGVLHKEGIEADAAAVAEQLSEEEIAPWRGEHDEVLKRLVTRCLELRPEKRFHDMIELCQEWERENLQVRHHAEMELVGGKLRDTRRWKRRLAWGLAASLLMAAGLLAIWQVREARLQKDRTIAREAEAAALQNWQTAEEQASAAEEQRRGAEASLAKAENTVELLEGSRRQLLDWALAEGGGVLPVLTGREGRLQLLDEQFQELLAAQEGKETAREWRRQWQAERARVALLGDGWRRARELVKDDVSLLGGRGLTTLLLRESEEEDVAEEELALAKNLIKRSPAPERSWMEALLGLVEARNLERRGQRDRALQLLTELNRQSAKLPTGVVGTASLWRTRLQRETADVADGAGRGDLARSFREEMVAELRNELGASDVSGKLRQDLTEQFVIAASGLAEQIYAAGELKQARALSEEALELLSESGVPQVRMAQAMHHAVLSGWEREMGDDEVAREELAVAMELIEMPSQEGGDDPWRLYREGMLRWQLSGVVGQAGEEEKEIELALEALQTMRSLLESDGVRPSPLQIHHVMGYLCGDLAQALEKKGDSEAARAQIDNAIASWKFLCDSKPDEPEYAAGLAWCEKLRDES